MSIDIIVDSSTVAVFFCVGHGWGPLDTEKFELHPPNVGALKIKIAPSQKGRAGRDAAHIDDIAVLKIAPT